MNPLNLIADADILRIKGEVDAIRETITWTVEARIPDPRVEEPGTTHPILTFSAPVGDDPATAYAIPEGLECLVTAAASLYGLGVATAPVDPPIAAFNALRRRVEAQLDAAVLPEGHDYEVSPAPRCSHNFLGPHTVTAGSVASGYIETECPGPARIACGWHAGTGIDPACAFCNPGPDTIKVESLEGTHDPASIRVTGTTLEDAPERGPLEGHVVKAERDGDTIRLEVAYRVPPIIDGPIDLRFTTDPPQDPTVRKCRHGEVGPHGTDALDRGPTCPGPVPCKHGFTGPHPWPADHQAGGHCNGPTDLDHIKAGVCPTHYTPLDPQGQCTHLDHNTTPATHETSTQAPEPGSSPPRDPEPGASAHENAGHNLKAGECKLRLEWAVWVPGEHCVVCEGDPTGYARYAWGLYDRAAASGLLLDPPPWPRPSTAEAPSVAEPSERKPRPPLCVTCGAEIIPATGWGRGWKHRDGLPAGAKGDHVPVPKIFIDPPPPGALTVEPH